MRTGWLFYMASQNYVCRTLRANIENDIQGKVLAVSSSLRSVSVPFAFAIAGPLAEYVFEPAFERKSYWTNIFGAGPGRGICAIFVILGLSLTLVSFMASFSTSIRELDSQIASTEEEPPKED